ncbi:EAL domain-containing protein [Thalassospira alkalitolerans]|uniref:EAL domain-containing protein n=1 Tax=Thalassospira alkalitolerans TaxID=1293890 RepID=UPI003AA981D4
MTVSSSKSELSIAKFVENLRKLGANGKRPAVAILNIPVSLRLDPQDYQDISRDAFHHLPEKTQVYRLDNGMMTFIRAAKSFPEVDTFLANVLETLNEVLDRQGLGDLPVKLWHEFRWPDDRKAMYDLLGLPEENHFATEMLERFDMSEMLRGAITEEAVFDSCRRQAILEFYDSRREVLGHELYCSLDYLRQHHLASFLLEGPGEVEILSGVLDEKLMDVTKSLAPQMLPDTLHLNMMVQTIFSDHFTEFLSSEDSRFAENLAIEFSLENAIADWWEFEDACKLLRSAGVRVGLDRITLPSLEFLSPRKMNVDFIKVIWDQNILGSKRADATDRLREFAALFDSRNLILTRCDSRTALRMGRSLGVDAFQGSYIDALLGKYLHNDCKSRNTTTDRKCAVCQWAPRELRKNGCNFHFRAGKILAEI